MQARETAARRLVRPRLPVEAPGNEREAPLLRQEGEIADANDRILQMRRDDREVFRIEGDELQEVHG